MARASSQSGQCSQLENFDLTRKIYTVRNLEVLTRLIEQEANKATPDLGAIAGLGTAVAALLSAVG